MNKNQERITTLFHVIILKITFLHHKTKFMAISQVKITTRFMTSCQVVKKKKK